jgi:uncharacterized protein (DUF1684 family)
MISDNSYIKSVEKYRYSRDSFYKFSPESPLPPREKMPFMQLNYFDVDSNFRVTATLDLLATPESYMMGMTNAADEQYYKMGILNFTLKGKPYKLAVYQSGNFLNRGLHKDQLFLPFSDESNGKETYEGGRFIDIDYTGQSQITLDFNYAYNPSCAYNHEFSCPVPPAENHLPVKIEAGEKKYGDVVRIF